MAGVYGDMLLAWPEQQRVFQVYEMTPKINGGWDIVKDKSGNIIYTQIIGVLQNTRGGGLKESNGNLVSTEGRELWTQTAGLAGKFFEFENAVYRLSEVNNWSYEGGFYRYGVNKVVGNDATESDNAAWNLGTNSFC